MIYIFLFILGSIFGSFLNVCVYRLPREEKIGMTRSRCPHCKKTIVWYDNIPFISYILLKGRCRNCKRKISPRYFIVEFITACALCGLWWFFGGGTSGIVFVAVYFVFFCLLIIGSFIDLEFLIIPDVINLSGMVVGLTACAVYPQLMKADLWYIGLLRSFIGLLAGGGTLYTIAVVGSYAFKKEAMGMGDVKLLAMVGSFIGWKNALFTIFWSSLLGTIIGVILILTKKTDLKGKIPFGPFLAMGAVISLLWGQKIIVLYLKMF